MHLYERMHGNQKQRIYHKVELTGDRNSFVEASYFFDDEVEFTTYYKGPAADIERLDEELDRESDKLFAMALGILRTKIEKALI